MSTYRLLEDHYINNALLPAGSVVTDTGAGAQIPVGWTPTPAVDPLDSGAVTQFYNAGPVLSGLVRAQFSTQAVPSPTTYWTRQGNGQYALTGLGASLPAQWPWRI
jgi:hypothetical protein